MVEAVMQDVETFVSLRQNTFVQFIASRPLVYLFLVEGWILGPRVFKWWWEQYIVNLEGIRMAAWEAERMEGGRETDRTETETD